jgi:hypothetical protein
MEIMQFKDCRLARNQNISASEFRAIYGWVRCFMARHDLTIWYQMTVAQRLPDAYEERLLSSQKYVLKLRKQHEYLLGQIGNAKQTPVFLICGNPQQLTLLANEQ